MPSQAYLQDLTIRLAEGLAKLPEEVRIRHAAYLRAAQNSDGGFSGREGGSDLYYTAFGLRGLLVLDALTPEICERAAPFLRHSLTQQASVVDFFSLLYGCLLTQLGGGPDVLAGSPTDWPERVARTLETFRTPDGGYAKSAGGSSGSTYHTFLVGLCYQMLDLPWPRPDELARFIRSRQREDGGFVEIAPMRRGGTNPTAAAVGVLQIVDALRLEETDAVARFLLEMATPGGGFRANGRAPFADLLSTFTACWTLEQLGARDRLTRVPVQDFVKAVELPAGGFRAGTWDDRADVEYTFYGLGTWSLR